MENQTEKSSSIHNLTYRWTSMSEGMPQRKRATSEAGVPLI